MSLMSRGEMIARARHGLRTNPLGIPVEHVRGVARDHGLDAADVLRALTTPGVALYARIEWRRNTRWLVGVNP